MNRVIIYCADIGSVKKGKFAWARLAHDSETKSNEICELVDKIVNDLSEGLKIAIGFECPLFVPLNDEPEKLTSAREGEGNRPYSAGAGCASLVTGLTETTWILERVKETISLTSKLPKAFLCWEDFLNADAGIFVWEAFVSNKTEEDNNAPNADMNDALLGARAFQNKIKNQQIESDITCLKCRSLIGAALLQTGWGDNVSILSEPCLVVKG